MGVELVRRSVQASAAALGAAIALLPSPAGDRPAAPPPPEVPRAADPVAAHVGASLPSLGVNEAGELARVITEESSRAGLDPLLVLAVIRVESAWQTDAVSERGARGLMQIRRPTLEAEERRAGVAPGDPHDPVHNVRMGVRFLGRMVAEFGDVDRGLTAYNVGPTRYLDHLLAAEEVPDAVQAYARKVRREERRIRRQMVHAGMILADAAR